MSPEHVTAGRVKKVTSLANPLIKSIKSYQQKKYRDAEGVFVAEGLKLILDALDNQWQLQVLIYSHAMANQPQLQDIAARARAGGTDLLEVNDKILGSITRKNNPQSVVGIFRQKSLGLDEVTTGKQDFWIGLDRVRDPGNLGTIIRTADCVGANGIILIGETTDPWSMEAVRATMGSIFNIPLVQCDEQQLKEFSKKWPGMIIGTHLKGAVDYRSIDYHNGPVLALMGNEQSGLPDELTDLCSHRVLIPMNGKADSLNLAIATAIIAFEIKRSELKMPTFNNG